MGSWEELKKIVEGMKVRDPAQFEQPALPPKTMESWIQSSHYTEDKAYNAALNSVLTLLNKNMTKKQSKLEQEFEKIMTEKLGVKFVDVKPDKRVGMSQAKTEKKNT